MSKAMRYFEDEDILHITIQSGKEANSFEMAPNITVELNDKNEIIGIEILKATDYLRDGLLETVQAKLLQM